MVERTGDGDPARVVPLLWEQGGRVGRSGLTLEGVVAAGIGLADEVGIGQLTVRNVAQRLGVGAMTLYSYVPGKADLLDLMVDKVFAEVAYPEQVEGGWREGLVAVADRNWELLVRHTWLVDVDTARPPLGPGVMAKYDAELAPLVGSGLDDVEIDQALSLVLNHVWSSARQSLMLDRRAAGGGGDAEWWRQAGPMLAGRVVPERYPNATAIGEAAGQAYGAATDPRRAYAFGLRTILDGIEALIARRP
ncbi:TetR/AcrR family transcriptional regulator C-terminal domain-containing protein [Tessaracoccus sp. OS52]|uniref:TetR/AcrR family transcriptional regulator n=1 Tax=Tessaracoccus sp. OS52 TaxID=2886691 RepID=UPI001D107E6D|nr:TetR/AcrR family transcriptional regulator C-terminal domain-containing protein [Tessaracoccus sp. OS52]